MAKSKDTNVVVRMDEDRKDRLDDLIWEAKQHKVIDRTTSRSDLVRMQIEELISDLEQKIDEAEESG
jgi:hypothetical protein